MEYHALVMHFWQTGTFWVAVAVFIFFAAAGGKVWGIAAKMLDKRAEEIRSALNEAGVLKAEAEAMLAAARARQVQAEADAKSILASAQEEAARLADEFAKEARAVARRRERLALDRIAAAEKSALADVRAAAIDIATAATSKILRDGFDAAADAAMIDHSITGIPAALRQVS